MRWDPNCCEKSKKSQRLRGDQTAETLLLLMLPFGLCLQAEKEGEFGRRMGNICSILSNSRCRTQFSDLWQTKQHWEGAVGGGGGNTVQSKTAPAEPPGVLVTVWTGDGAEPKVWFGHQSDPPSRLQWASNPKPLCNEWRPSSQATQGSHF